MTRKVYEFAKGGMWEVCVGHVGAERMVWHLIEKRPKETADTKRQRQSQTECFH